MKKSTKILLVASFVACMAAKTTTSNTSVASAADSDLTITQTRSGTSYDANHWRWYANTVSGSQSYYSGSISFGLDPTGWQSSYGSYSICFRYALDTLSFASQLSWEEISEVNTVVTFYLLTVSQIQELVNDGYLYTPDRANTNGSSGIGLSDEFILQAGSVGYDDAYRVTTTASSGGTASFNCDWTNSTTSFLVAPGASIELLSTPNTNYFLEGWYTDSTYVSSSKLTSTTVTVNSNLNLYARFLLSQYTITFNSQGGSSVASQTIDYGKQVTQPTNPTRTGYTFGGWYLESAGTNAYNFTSSVTSSFTLYAKWEIVNYSITYNLNGGTNATSNPSSYNVLSSITFASPTKTGYSFLGWYTESGFSNKIESIAAGTTGNKTLYARWQVDTYSITYVLNDGTNNSSNVSSYNVETAVTLYDPSRLGYSFLGWYKESTFVNKVTSIAKGTTGNQTLYASWEVNVYSITYHLDGGVNSSYNPDSYTINSTSIFEDPTKTGYEFLGWYTDSAFTNQILYLERNTGNLDIYARWNTATYNINYHLNGGTNGASNPSSYTINDEVTFEDPTRNGYTFLGWFSDSNFVTPITSIAKGSTGAKDIYAKWEAINYMIDYNLNGGTNNESNPSSFTVEDEINLLDASKEGYDFVSWTDNNGNVVSSISKGTTGNIAVSANYTIINYSIDYVLDEGTNDASNPSSYTILDAITFKDPSKDNNVFRGWYLDESFTTSTTGIAEGSVGDIRIYAKWETLNDFKQDIINDSNVDPIVKEYLESHDIDVAEVETLEEVISSIESLDSTFNSLPSEDEASDEMFDAYKEELYATLLNEVSNGATAEEIQEIKEKCEETIASVSDVIVATSDIKNSETVNESTKEALSENVNALLEEILQNSLSKEVSSEEIAEQIAFVTNTVEVTVQIDEKKNGYNEETKYDEQSETMKAYYDKMQDYLDSKIEELFSEGNKFNLSEEDFEAFVEYVDYAFENVSTLIEEARECDGLNSKFSALIDQTIEKIEVEVFQDFDKEAMDKIFLEAADQALFYHVQGQTLNYLDELWNEIKADPSYNSHQLKELEKDYKNQRAFVENDEEFRKLYDEIKLEIEENGEDADFAKLSEKFLQRTSIELVEEPYVAHLSEADIAIFSLVGGAIGVCIVLLVASNIIERRKHGRKS